MGFVSCAGRSSSGRRSCLPPSMALPLAFFPALLDPSAITRDTEAMTELLRRAIPTIVASLVIGLVLGPISAAVCFRLARQFLDGEEASPFGSGWCGSPCGCSSRHVLRSGLVALLVIGLTRSRPRRDGAVGPVLVVILFVCVTLITAFVLGVRFSVAPVLCARGRLRARWPARLVADDRGARGQILRWLIVVGGARRTRVDLGSEMVSACVRRRGRPRTAGLLLGGAIVAPLSIVTSVVLIRLRHVLGTPPAPARPDRRAVPDVAATARRADAGVLMTATRTAPPGPGRNGRRLARSPTRSTASISRRCVVGPASSGGSTRTTSCPSGSPRWTSTWRSRSSRPSSGRRGSATRAIRSPSS